MDIALILVGSSVAFWGSRRKDQSGGLTGGGTAMLAIGGLAALVGVIIFAVAFAGGFQQGLQQGG